MRSSDIFSRLLGQEPLLEIKQKIFNDHLSMRERIDFSLIDKEHRKFYLQHISAAIVNDFDKVLAQHGFMQTYSIRLTVENIWSGWYAQEDSSTTAEREQIAARLLRYVQEDYPLDYETSNFLDLLCGKKVLPIKNLKFWSIAIYKILLDMGIEGDFQGVDIVTEENLEIVKEFIVGLNKCESLTLDADYHFAHGLKGLADFNGQEDVETVEFFEKAIARLEASLYELGLVEYAVQFKEHMQVTFFQDENSPKIKEVYSKVLQEQRMEVNRYTSKIDSDVFKRLRESLLKCNFMYIKNKRSAKMLYEFLTALAEKEISAFLDMLEYDDNDLGDHVLFFRKTFKWLQGFELEFDEKFIKDIFQDPHVRVSCIVGIKDYLEYNHYNYILLKDYLSHATQEIYKLYSNSNGIKIGPIVLRAMFMKLMDYDFIRKKSALSSVDGLLSVMIGDRDDGEETLIRKIEAILLDNDIRTINKWLERLPSVYARYAKILKKFDYHPGVIGVLYQEIEMGANTEEISIKLNLLTQLSPDALTAFLKAEGLKGRLLDLLILPKALFAHQFQKIKQHEDVIVYFDESADVYDLIIRCFYADRDCLGIQKSMSRLTLEDFKKLFHIKFNMSTSRGTPDGNVSTYMTSHLLNFAKECCYLMFELQYDTRQVEVIMACIAEQCGSEAFLRGFSNLLTDINLTFEELSNQPIKASFFIRQIISMLGSPIQAKSFKRTRDDDRNEDMSAPPTHKLFDRKASEVNSNAEDTMDVDLGVDSVVKPRNDS